VTFNWPAAFAAAVVIAGWVWSASHFVGRLEAREVADVREEASLAVLYAEKDRLTAWRSVAEVQLAKIDRVAAALEAADARDLAACRASASRR
jgi:hypothetical protein